MNAWRLRAELALAGVGAWPLLAGTLLLGVAALWSLLLPAQQQQAAQLRERAAAARGQAALRPVALAGPDSGDALLAFEAALARPDDATRLMQQVWSGAASAGVRLAKVDYRSDVDVAGGFGRLQMTMPVSGTYPAVKQFAFGLMAAFPALALDKLDIKRDSAAQAEIEATLHMTLLVRP